MKNKSTLPRSAIELRRRLRELREARRARHRSRPPGRRRPHLSSEHRALVFRKSGGRCHVCGGRVGPQWKADHVLAHSSGGVHSPENYLPAHALCNGYRWDYDPEEFQWLLKIGVWARRQMERGTETGSAMLTVFFRHEVQRHGRRAQDTQKLSPCVRRNA